MRNAKQLALTLGLAAALGAGWAGQALAQDPRLQGRVPESVRGAIDQMVSAARADGLPTEPLVDRALEGASKGAEAQRILDAVQRLDGELRIARDALGVVSSPTEIAAGASALRAGARAEDLARLREIRGGQPLTVAAAVLADLVAVGVPTDTAVAAVLVLAAAADDAEYMAFRQNVERDIALGASPITALGVRLDAAAEYFDQTTGVDRAGASRPRKP